MQPFSAIFRIVKTNNCPLYRSGEYFRLTARIFSPPEDKDACLILVREMTELLVKLSEQQGRDTVEQRTRHYSCSGCTGLIKFTRATLPGPYSESGGQQEIPFSSKKRTMFGKLMASPLFRAMPYEHLREMLDRFHEVQIPRGRAVITKGAINNDLYVVVSGELSVDDGHVHIDRLGPGEMCGEMSSFSNNSACATVTALTETQLIVITLDDFTELLEQASSAHRAMIRLLARRLARTNKKRLQDLDSCMRGRRVGPMPAELLRRIHLRRKTGLLVLMFSGERAEVFFREGAIIKARYKDFVDEQAVYAIVAENGGGYAFRAGLSHELQKNGQIGNFMSLLAEGARRAEEARKLTDGTRSGTD